MEAGTLVFWFPWNRVELPMRRGVVTGEFIQRIGSKEMETFTSDGDSFFVLTPGTKVYGDKVFVEPHRNI